MENMYKKERKKVSKKEKESREGWRGEVGKGRGIKKELKYIMYMYEFIHYKYVLLKIKI